MEVPNVKMPINWSKINTYRIQEENKSAVDKKVTSGILWRALLSTQHDEPLVEDDDDDDIEEDDSEGHLTSERKKRKAMLKLSVKPISGVSRVTIKKSKTEDKQQESLTSEVAASASTMDGHRLGEIIKALGMQSFFSTPTPAPPSSTMRDEGYARRLEEISGFVIHEGNRIRLGELIKEIIDGFVIHSMYSTPTMSASTSTMDVQNEIQRWSFREEIKKPFDALLTSRFSELEEKALMSASMKKEHGDYTCENVLSIWPKLRKEHKMRRGPRDVGNREKFKGPRDVGEEIKKNLLESDMKMIEKGTSIHDVGLVTFSLSREWMAKGIHKMLKNGIDTWAPELPMERVIVDYPSLDEEIHVDLFRRRAIGDTLIRMLQFSKVAATIGPTQDILATFHNYAKRDEIHDWAHKVLKKWFPKKKRERNVVIKGKVPFILAKRDFDNIYKDLFALWYGCCVHKADWILYVTPIRQQKYVEMCFTAAELEKWIPSDRHGPPRTSYAGYRACTTELSDNLLDEAKTRSKAVERGWAASMLGYSAEAVLDCVFKYTYLKDHRLAVSKFDVDGMFHKEGNTFIYLLNTRQLVLSVTNKGDFRPYIDELKKVSEFSYNECWTQQASKFPWMYDEAKWMEDANRGMGEERMLVFHLLSFTEDLKDSCLFVLPHMLCGYLYDLAMKFNNYYSSVCKVMPLLEPSKSPFLLLSEATALVMDKCFHLLGLTPTPSFLDLSLTQLPAGFLMSGKLPMDINVRYPPRNSRFELFSVLPSITTDTVKEGKLFGVIAVSDNYGILSDEGFHLSEPDFAYVTLFNRNWINPIEMIDCEIVYLGNPCSRHSVPLSSSIRIQMRLFVTATKKKKDTCFLLCNDLSELNMSRFWDEKSVGECGYLPVKGEDGMTDVHYILLKDAVDTDIEISFKTESDHGLKVNGNIFASYGNNFPYGDNQLMADYYQALIFQPNHELLKNEVSISLRRSMLAVPVDGSLVIRAYLVEVDSGKVIIDGSYIFKSKRDDISVGVIKGTKGTICSLNLKVHWKYQTQCP